MNNNTLITTATNQTCNFQTDFNTKKKKAQGRIWHVLLFLEKLQESASKINISKKSTILKEFWGHINEKSRI